MPGRHSKRRFVFGFIASVSLSGCHGFDNARETLTPEGPASLRSVAYKLPDYDNNENKWSPLGSTGHVALFETAYAVAYKDQLAINAGNPHAGSAKDPFSIHARQMAFEGVHLADSFCALFFRYGSDNQKWLLVTKDLIAALGTLATGALALASPQSHTATGILSLATGALYGGIDVYTRNFLFNSDNIEAVRQMTWSALAVDSAKAFPANDTSIWTFDGAVEVIDQHQAICRPAAIRSLVLEAIKGTKFTVDQPPGAPVPGGSEAHSGARAAALTVTPASTAAAAASPENASAARPAAAAAAVIAPAAASAAAAVPGATQASIYQATRQAVFAGARDVAQSNAPGATRAALDKIATAITNKVAAPVADAVIAAPEPVAPTQPPATRQQTIRVDRR